MQLCINAKFGYPELTDAQRFQKIAAAGFHAVFPAWKQPGDALAAAELADRYSLSLQSVHAPFGSISAMWEPDKWQAELESQVAVLEECHSAGASLVICHVFIGFGEEHPNETGLHSFGLLLNEAQRLGIRLAFENTEGESYLQAIRDAYWSHPCAGFCWDSGHEQCYNRGNDMLDKYGSKLFGTHLNDNFGITGNEITWKDDSHLVPGDGIINWSRVARRLAKTGLNDFLTFELTTSNKPDRHTHDRYANLSCEEYLARVYRRAAKMDERLLDFRL